MFKNPRLITVVVVGVGLLFIQAIRSGVTNAQTEKPSTKPAESAQKLLPFLENLEGSTSQNFVLFTPSPDQVVMKNTIQFKGINRFLTDVFVDGKKVKIRPDGRFLVQHKLEKLGKQNVFISYTTPDYQIITIRRKVIRLRTPHSLVKNEDAARLWNTAMFQFLRHQSLTEPLTRSELAIYLSKITQSVPPIPKVNIFEDVPSDHSAARYIALATERGWMAPYPNGKFHPNQSVSRMEMILSLVKALNLNPITEGLTITYQDVPHDSWIAKYVEAAYRAGILPKTAKLTPQNELDRKTLVEWSVGVPAQENNVAQLLDFETGFDVKPEHLAALLSPIEAFLKQKAEEIEALKHITITSPKEKSLVFGNSVTIKGEIYPPGKFELNGNSIVPGPDGLFAKEVILESGRNQISVTAFDKTTHYELFHLQGYADLKHHWIAETAAKMKYLGLLPDKDNFEPQKFVTKAEFAHYVATALEMTPSKSENSDLSEPVRIMVEKGILSLGPDQQFHGDRIITRAQAVTAIIRAAQIAIATTNSALPYEDVSDTHWVNRYVNAALEAGIISSGHYFYPRNKLSRAHLVAMLGKLPKIKDRINEIFEDD